MATNAEHQAAWRRRRAERLKALEEQVADLLNDDGLEVPFDRARVDACNASVMAANDIDVLKKSLCNLNRSFAEQAHEIRRLRETASQPLDPYVRVKVMKDLEREATRTARSKFNTSGVSAVRGILADLCREYESKHGLPNMYLDPGYRSGKEDEVTGLKEIIAEHESTILRLKAELSNAEDALFDAAAPLTADQQQ